MSILWLPHQSSTPPNDGRGKERQGHCHHTNGNTATASSSKAVAVLEVTGVAPQLPSLIERLQSHHTVKFVKVSAPADVCLQRVRERDQSTQVDVSEARVLEINRLAAAVEYPWDLIVDNGSFKADQEILGLLEDLLK